jgi:ribosomal protein S3
MRDVDDNRLAGIIRDYWAEWGLNPSVWVGREIAKASNTDRRPVCTIRSDILGGWSRAHTLPGVRGMGLKIIPGVHSDSASPFAPLAGIRQRLAANATVRPSYESHEFREQYARARACPH